jgi:hypothetical protein
MAVLIFASIYFLATVISAVVMLPARMHGRARGFAPGMLSPIGTVFALFVVFTPAEVWTKNDRAAAAVDQEASALRAALILAADFPGEPQKRLETLVRSHIEEAATTEWPMMEHQTSTLKMIPRHLAEALRLTLDLEPGSRGQEIAQREMTAQLQTALDAGRQRIIISHSSVSWLKWACLWVQAVCVLITIALSHGDNRGAAIVAMGLFATGTAACLLLIAAYDRPFVLSVKPDPLPEASAQP